MVPGYWNCSTTTTTANGWESPTANYFNNYYITPTPAPVEECRDRNGKKPPPYVHLLLQEPAPKFVPIKTRCPKPNNIPRFMNAPAARWASR